MVEEEQVCEDAEHEFVARALKQEWHVEAVLEEYVELAVSRAKTHEISVPETPEAVLDAADRVSPCVRAAFGRERVHDSEDVGDARHVVLRVRLA